MLKRYFVKLSYDGTNYSGWQIQPNAHTVQAELQNNLTKLNGGEPIKIMGCGRTDSGVHARNFYMHMDYSPIEDIDHFIFKLNHMLPEDIVIHDIYEVSPKSHSRFDAIERTYKYNINTEKSPFERYHSYHFYEKLNIEKMNEAAAILLKHEDFEAFSKVKTAVNTFNCDIQKAVWVKNDQGLEFTIKANRFLRNMVRAVVGTLLEVGTGRITIAEFEEIILSKSRAKAGKSVPARGLCLTDVKYPFNLIRN